MTEPTNNLPFLRALKCAYKLHKAGLDEYQTTNYLIEASRAVFKGDPLPSAATPVQDILPATFNFDGSILGAEYWPVIQAKLQASVS